MANSSDSNTIDVSDDLKASLDRMALACRILEMEGHGNFTLGHLAFRDPEGRGAWMKRWGMTLGEVQDWADFQLIDFDGNLLYGEGNRRHSEWPIHVGIFKRRPNIIATAHTHPHHGTVFSSTSAPLRPLSIAGGHFEKPPPRFTATSELIRKAELGDEIAEVMGDSYAIFLRNHGVAFCGESIEKMINIGVQLEITCQQHLEIAASGLPYDWPDDAEQARKFSTMGEERNVLLFFEHFAKKLDRVQKLGHPDLPLQR